MKDFSLQGKVWLGENLNGQPGAMNWVNDAALLQISASSEEEQRRESWSGKRNISATLSTGSEVSFTLTLNHANAKNLALGLYGTVNTVASDSVTAEAFPTGLVADDHVVLDRGNISNLVIEDSAGSPVTLVLDTNYEIADAVGGVIRILDPASLTQPFNADYDHGASTDVTMFTQKAPVRYLIMTGENTVDGSADKVRVRLYKLKFNPVNTLDLINDQFGEIQLTGTAILDTNNEPSADLGGFGRIELLEAS
ncbi:hypothetical protein Q7C_841 [Methylophaga frappieri]|uniref:Uncharacterized protein n=1 Tax=Methylophaga frappieri (strain ATCC BAA-2434 / DSM 25690 / JAM7) TaxID=754477 RepID=I1YGG7_METFJ|nr:hypothetical protein [Methylophaga frappieri]AFJ02010.1 hypothetical protein Q7C_841 [Methylophaga frappieri]